MKRIAFVLALLLALSCLPAHAENPLDAAFAACSAALVETAAAGFDLSACELVFPENFWTYMGAEKPSEAELAGMKSALLPEAQVFSVSPTGDSALYEVSGMVFAVNGDQIAFLCPSETRGVADEFGNMEKLFKRGLRQCLSDEGVTWSHDGRYAVITSYEQVLSMAQFIFDPMIIDTLTGEVFLTATYGNKIMREEGGALVSACFSRDGRYLYYTFFGNIGEYRCSQLRCELETGETELLHNGQELLYYPRLCELRDGSLLSVCDQSSRDKPMGIARLSGTGAWLTGGNWNVRVTNFDLPASQWFVKQLEYSAESGWAACIGMTWGGVGYALQRFRPDEGYSGIDQRWLLRADTMQFVPMEGSVEDLFSQTSESGSPLLSYEYCFLMAAALSPDGQYALLEVGKREPDATPDWQLLLVRLEDMQAVPVTGLPEGALMPYRTALTKKFAPGIEWNCDEILLLVDSDVRSFRFEVAG